MLVGWITNNTEKVEEIVQEIQTKAAVFNLDDSTGLKPGCDILNVEEHCVSSYESGRDFMEKLKTHVNNVGKYLTDISETLQQADQDAKKRVESQFTLVQPGSGGATQ